MSTAIYDQLVAHWDSEEGTEKSQIFSNNRRSRAEIERATPTHTAGQRSFARVAHEIARNRGCDSGKDHRSSLPVRGELWIDPTFASRNQQSLSRGCPTGCQRTYLRRRWNGDSVGWWSSRCSIDRSPRRTN
ncbi:PREDICTED: uncharacterized protein LOC104814750 [Tarenaya hassleriana]|uniref:uncharacterized protein LOC104814750 n=1 Tax=Tarenaya hassleriana TaxID=28532 RepID=UPI00053C54B0|nr:PREDICTED: uncharacterized protein LOC104814750 [Tarenaya hassleriana]